MKRPWKMSGAISHIITQGSWRGAPSPPYFSRSKRSEKVSISAIALPARLPIPAIRSMRWPRVSTPWVTSSGSIVTGTPEVSTMSAASGSTKMLNSAAGLMLPTSK